MAPRYTILNVQTLIAQLRGLAPDTRVILSIDEEGNAFHYMVAEGGVETCTVDGLPAVLLMPYGPSCGEPDYDEVDVLEE